MDAFTERFDKGLKTSFSEDSRPQFVKFGSARDNDSSRGIKGGKLTLQGWASFVHTKSHKLKLFFLLRAGQRSRSSSDLLLML